MRRPIILAIATVLGAGALAAVQQPTLPQPFSTPSADNNPLVVPPPDGAALQLPPGFSAELWADGFAKPRYMLEGPGGEILISDSGHDAERQGSEPPAARGRDGAVYAVPPGRAAERVTLIGGLDRPYGLAFWRDYLYVAESQSIKRYPYDSHRLEAGPGEEVISLEGLGRGHWTRSLLFDGAGETLYVAIGSESNVKPGEDPRRAAINAYRPDGSSHRIFASGLRNAVGLHWYPGRDELWATVQERDGLGDDVPPDYFTAVRKEGFYGWPYAYVGPHPDPRLDGRRMDLVKTTLRPDVLLGAHQGVLDFAFYTGTQFPPEYRGGAFIALHGSWNRRERTGYSVVFIPFRDGRPAGAPREFITGWMLSPERREVWGRPVAVLQTRDGSLLVSDDGARRIWRISYPGDGRHTLRSVEEVLR
jgi:glucose/arabinose dehydrogenase